MAVNPVAQETAPFRCEIAESSPGIVSLTAFGELDLATVPRLERGFMDVESAGPRTIVLDLRPLEFIDLAGARCIVAADARARAAGRAFHLLAGQRAERLFSLANLDGLSVLDD
jgi:anti-anti-sigma factor